MLSRDTADGGSEPEAERTEDNGVMASVFDAGGAFAAEIGITSSVGGDAGCLISLPVEILTSCDNLRRKRNRKIEVDGSRRSGSSER